MHFAVDPLVCDHIDLVCDYDDIMEVDRSQSTDQSSASGMQKQSKVSDVSLRVNSAQCGNEVPSADSESTRLAVAAGVDSVS